MSAEFPKSVGSDELPEILGQVAPDTGEQLAEGALADIDHADIPAQGGGAEPVVTGGEPSAEGVVTDGQLQVQETRPDRETAETIAHATNKLETLVHSNEKRHRWYTNEGGQQIHVSEAGAVPEDTIERVKNALRQQIEFMEADPQRAESMYLETKAQLFDELHKTIRDQVEWATRGGGANVSVPDYELRNILRDFDETRVDISFGAAISRAAAGEQQAHLSAVA